MKWGEVRFQVPKFDFHTKLDLHISLQDLGLKQAFTTKAQSPHISEQKPLFISTIQQESKISLHEEGIEAISYTAIGQTGYAARKGSSRLDLNLNRPFLYVITKEVDAQDIPIFMGICNNPSLS